MASKRASVCLRTVRPHSGTLSTVSASVTQAPANSKITHVPSDLTVRTSLAAGLEVWLLPGRRPQQALMYRLTEMAHLRPYLLVSGWQSCLGLLALCQGGGQLRFLSLDVVLDHFRQQSRSVSDIWALLTLHGLAWVFIFA